MRSTIKWRFPYEPEKSGGPAGWAGGPDRSVWSSSRESAMSVQPDRDLHPPVALVTGSTSGIGRAVAVKLARDGFYGIAHGRDAARGRATIEEIESNGGHGRFISAALAVPADPQGLSGGAGAGEV